MTLACLWNTLTCWFPARGFKSATASLMRVACVCMRRRMWIECWIALQSCMILRRRGTSRGGRRRDEDGILRVHCYNSNSKNSSFTNVKTRNLKQQLYTCIGGPARGAITIVLLYQYLAKQQQKYTYTQIAWMTYHCILLYQHIPIYGNKSCLLYGLCGGFIIGLVYE